MGPMRCCRRLGQLALAWVGGGPSLCPRVAGRANLEAWSLRPSAVASVTSVARKFPGNSQRSRNTARSSFYILVVAHRDVTYVKVNRRESRQESKTRCQSESIACRIH